ncbi:MAG: hypothetical protein P1U74_10550 [Legionellaceae bacterium]|nr:hypothetical protein [Legionellaceae bacterium]
MHNPTDKWIQINKIPASSSAKVTVNLKPYIDAYRQYKDVERAISNEIEDSDEYTKQILLVLYESAKNKYEQIKQELIKETFEDTYSYWPDLVDEVMDLEQFNSIDEEDLLDEELEAIEAVREFKKTASYTYMEDSFIEIIKNSMDQIIIHTLQSGLDSNRANLELTVDLEEDPESKEIIVTCTDNAGGFDEEFLTKNLSSFESKEAYVNRCHKTKLSDNIDGSSSGTKTSEEMPTLFGGQNRGLRLLIALVDNGDVLEPNGKRIPTYAPLESSKVQFENNPQNDGAVVRIITSKEPLEFIYERDNITANDSSKKEGNDGSPLSIDTDFSM